MPDIKSIAITRPQEDAQKLAGELQVKGYFTHIVPMLDIRPIAQSAVELEKVIQQRSPQAILVTSKHAVRVLGQQDAGRSVPVCAVGEVTASEAKAAGFNAVTDAGGSAQALVDYIQKQYNPALGGLLYARGADVSTDISGVLRKAGFTVTEVITYKAEFTESLPESYVDALKANAVDAVMFFSRRSAENYVRLVHDKGMEQYHCSCVAIGETYLAEALAAVPFLRIQQRLL